MGKDIIKGNKEGGSSISAADYLERYRAYLTVERGLQPASISAYINDLELFFNFLDLKNITLNDLNFSILRENVASQECPVRTIYRRIAVLNSFFIYIFSEKIISESFFLPHMKTKKIDVKGYMVSNEYIDNLIEVLPKYKMFGVQTIVMILLCNDCGCRIDELLNFQLSDIDNNVIILNGHRFILSNRTLDSLSNYINNYRRHIKTSPGFDNFLYINSKGKKIQRVTAILAISKAAHAANVPISFKILRFSCIYR